MHSFCTEDCAASIFRSKAVCVMLGGRQPALGGRLQNGRRKPLLIPRKGIDAMAFVPVPNTVLAELRMLYDSQKVENTLWFDLGAAPTATVMEALAGGLLSWWTNFYAPLCQVGVQLREVCITDMSSATGPQIIEAATTGNFGLNTSPPKPSSAALTVSFRTAARGRSFRGRNYVVGLTQDSLNLNTVTDAFANACVTAYSALLPSGTAEHPGVWVVASRFHGIGADKKPIPRTTGIATPIIAVSVVDKTVDSQRRRLPGRGK